MIQSYLLENANESDFLEPAMAGGYDYVEYPCRQIVFQQENESLNTILMGYYPVVQFYQHHQ